MSLGIEQTLTPTTHLSGVPDMSTATAVPVVNPVLTPTVFNPNVKDSRWLTLEVCREFTRNKCTRTDTECKFAHPPAHVEVQNGRVTCCFDSIKGKCQRKEPPCKYLHPPQHLREQLLQNGRNNLIIKQFQAQALTNQLMMPSVYPNMAPHNLLQYSYPTTSPFITPMPGMMTQLDATQSATAPLAQVSAPMAVSGVTNSATLQSQKLQQQRNDRLDAAINGNPAPEVAYNSGSAIDGLNSAQYPLYLQGMNGMSTPGMVSFKHRAMDKSGVPVYQPTPAGYAPLVQFNQQPTAPAGLVPVTQQTLQYYRSDQTSPYSPVAGPTGAPTLQRY